VCFSSATNSRCSLRTATARIRWPHQRAQTEVCATAPLTLSGALPYFVTGSCEPTTTVSGLSSRPAILRWPSQRSPGPPAAQIIADRDGMNRGTAAPEDTGVKSWVTAKVGKNQQTLPEFFVSVASKGFKLTVSPAELTVAGPPQTIDFTRLGGPKMPANKASAKDPASVAYKGFSSSIRQPTNTPLTVGFIHTSRLGFDMDANRHFVGS